MRTRILGIVLTIVLATSCFFSNCTLMSVEAATDVCITLDGDLLDWDHIRKMYTSEGRMVQMAAFQTDDSVYLMRELSDLSAFGGEQMYFDTDGDATNGYTNCGIDWMLQGSALYKYIGANGQWGWESVGTYQDGVYTREMSSDNAVAEYNIPLSSFDDYTGGSIRVNVNPYDSNWGSFAAYPASTTDLAPIPAYADVYQESDAVPITNVALTLTGGSLQAITEPTMQGGVAATLSAEGGDGTFKYSFATSAVYGIDNDKFEISGNKLIVKNSVLAPGSYSIYVNVKSDIRSAKAALTFVVGAASPSAVIDESVFSGQNGQWFAVNYDAANTIPTLKALKAVTDGVYLYAFVDATTLSHNAEFYIATSAEGGKDLTDVWPDAGSVKYKVDMEGTLYEYTDDWNAVGDVLIYKTGVGAEIKVALADLGNASGTLRVGVTETGSNYLPNEGKEMFSLITPIPGEMPEITHDGDPADWEGIEPIANGTGTVGDLYAMHDDNNLYVMTYLSDVQPADWEAPYTALSTNFFINGDGDATTGFQHAAYPNGSGADFLIQDWYCVGSAEENVEFFYTVESTGGWSNRGSLTSFKKFMDMGDGVYCIEFALPISEMKKATNTVSDDMYVAVHRSETIVGLQAGTKAGGTDADAFVFVPKYTKNVPVNVGDNAFGDWNNVARMATNTSTDSTSNLFATRSDERLYTLVTNELGGLNTINAYYISTGDDTGYTVSGYEKIDFVVKDAKLFAVTADNTLEFVDDAWMSYYNDNIEMQLYLSQLGNPETIKIAYRGAGGSLAIPADNSMVNVTAEFELNREEGKYYPTEDFATFTNPYKGWVSWAGSYSGKSDQYDKYKAGEQYFDYNTVYLGVRWSELQPNSDQDWELDAILEKYNVEKWIAEGKRINFRFLMDNPEELNGGNLKDRMDIPKWLYEELVEAAIAAGEGEEGAGTFYHDADGSMGLGYDVAGFSPNYYNKKLIERHDEVIMKLAEYFDNTAITSFVQVGSIGHWAEFHCWPEGTGVWPNPSTCAKYMEPYAKYFENVKIGVRKPYPFAAANNFGLFNDIFGSAHTGTSEFYNYFTNGCTDMNGGATGEEVEASKMPYFWKTNYSGGEFSDGQIRIHITNDTALDGSKGIMGTLDQIRYTHVSWMGPCSPADIQAAELDGVLYETNVLAMLKTMGYNFALEKIDQLTEIAKGIDTNISMTWNNEGVAPFYYNWPIEFSLIDAEGNVVYTTTVESGITEWLPGRSNVDATFNVSADVPAGNYTLAVAIADQDSLEPGLKLAIDGGRDDLRYPLYTVNVIENKYNIAFNGNGSTSGSMTNLSNVVCGADVALTANAYKKTGYTFAGWNTAANGTGKAYADRASVNSLTTTDGATVTLYAQWTPNKYTVKFDKNGATTGTMANLANCVYNKSYTLKANAYKKTGYTFAGWSNTKTGKVVYKDKASIKNLTATNGASVTLYAQWTPIKYVVKLDKNGANSGTMSNVNIVYDKAVALKANAYKKTGYTFVGWNTKKDGKGTTYKDKGSVKNLTATNGTTVTLYAQWKANTYTVKFNANSGKDKVTGKMSNLANRKYDKKFNLTANKFKRAGYLFTGWNTKKNGKGKAYADKASVKNLVAENGKTVTLYAQWERIRYTVKFNANGGTGKMKDMPNRNYGGSFKLNELKFKRNGYKFTGWNTKANGKGKSYANREKVKNLVSKNKGTITLYAQWKKVDYTITYKLNGGKNVSSNPKKYDVTKAVKLKNPTKKGYVFKGWYADKKFKKQVTQIKKGSTGNIVLYAKWQKKGK